MATVLDQEPEDLPVGEWTQGVATALSPFPPSGFLGLEVKD